MSNDKEYNRQWYERNREKKKQYNKKRYEENSEDRKERAKEWRKNNPEKFKASCKKWYMENREHRKEYDKKRNKDPQYLLKKHLVWDKKYRENNRDKLAEAERIRQSTHRMKWYQYLKNLGLTKCSKCGYDKCYAAIEYHHINPQEKEVSCATLFRSAITVKRMNEVKKTIPLCANCHRELHWGIKEVVNG